MFSVFSCSLTGDLLTAALRCKRSYTPLINEVHSVWAVSTNLQVKTRNRFWNFFSCLTNGLCAVLQVCLRYYEHEFVELACQCPAVVCCRCSPTQKAQIVTLLQQHTANRTCAIGKWWAPQQRRVPGGVGSKFLLQPVPIDQFSGNCTPPTVISSSTWFSQHDVLTECCSISSRYSAVYTPSSMRKHRDEAGVWSLAFLLNSALEECPLQLVLFAKAFVDPTWNQISGMSTYKCYWSWTS